MGPGNPPPPHGPNISQFHAFSPDKLANSYVGSHAGGLAPRPTEILDPPLPGRLMILYVAGADPGFGQGEDPASEAESCRCSRVESCERSDLPAAGVQGPLKGPGSF